MRRLAVIPARGGSKGIPRKNIRKFMGRPVIAYSIGAAIKSGLFDEIMVSTDDEEIAELAEYYGANVPFLRSARNALGHVTTVDVLLEVLEKFREKGIRFQQACCIYPVAPMISSRELYLAYNKMRKRNYDCIVPVTRFSYPVQRALRLKDGKLEMMTPDYLSVRSQDLEVAYHDCGQFYWFEVEQFIAKKALFTDNTGAIVLNEMEVQDIDTEIDWQLAELKFQLMDIDHENKSPIKSRRA